MGKSKSKAKKKVVKAAALATSSNPPTQGTLKCTECSTTRMCTADELAEHRRTAHAQCVCCYGSHQISQMSVTCGAGHSLCVACCKHFVTSQIASKSYPMSCSLCKAEFQASDIYRILNEKQLQDYTNIAIFRTLTANEVLLSCCNAPCTAACIVELGDCSAKLRDYHSTWIKCAQCKVSTCVVCLESSSKRAKKHSQDCAGLSEVKLAFENAISEGAAFRCPTCKVAGRKDNGCNAIYCVQCKTNWCYVCGKAQLGSHGCTAHVHTALQLGSEDALHRNNTLALLQMLYKKYGAVQFQTMWARFPSISAHGYTWDEITQKVKTAM